MTQRILILETSGSVGLVGLAADAAMVEQARLDPARRHARDLAPTVAALLQRQGWKPRDVSCIVVSRGPGSYTGLRVGIMSAKAFAFATGCKLVAIDTFAAIALQAPAAAARVDVCGDAQQDKVYVQRFERPGGVLTPVTELIVCEVNEWLPRLDGSVLATGPGLRRQGHRLPAGCPQAAEADWEPRLDSLLALGLPRLAAGQVDDFWQIEPLYRRPSSAEEKWDRLGK